jgi:N-acetylglutamate synthase-like GNAT family acetyltransferase
MKFVRKALETDSIRLQSFLLKSKLDTRNINEKINSFYLLTDSEDSLYAASCIVVVENKALLRTSAIDSNLSIEEILQFFRALLKQLASNGTEHVYLCAGGEGAANFFKALGFRVLDVAEVMGIEDNFFKEEEKPHGEVWLGYEF